MKNRIKEIRKELKKTQSEFAEELHLASNYISLIESGKNPVSDKFIYKVCDTYKVNETWLRTGEGEMLAPMSRDQEIASIASQIIKEDNPLKLELEKIVCNLTDEQLKNIYEVAKKLVDSMEKEKDIP